MQERVAEQPSLYERRRQSFDVLASVAMARYDLDHFDGVVLPETMQRIEDEELSYIAEGMGEEACTEFKLIRDTQGQLTYFDKGRWRPYTDMLAEAIEVHKAEATADPRKEFLVDHAHEDLKYGLRMQALLPGQTLRWHSSYCHYEARLYGKKFVDGLGFVSSREMGFLYEADCLPDGSIAFYSQTLDKSDQDAFDAATRVAHGGASIKQRVRAYDAVLEEKYGKRFHAGRELADGELLPEEDAWQKLLKERDLIEHYKSKIVWLARQSIAMSELQTYTEKKKLTYGVWAALRKRFDKSPSSFSTRIVQTSENAEYAGPTQSRDLDYEIMAARQEFAALGRELIGCGGVIKVTNEDELLLADPESVRDTIFGKKDDDGDCEFTSKKCPECGEKNVKTIVKIKGYYAGRKKKRVTGSCGCSKDY